MLKAIKLLNIRRPKVKNGDGEIMRFDINNYRNKFVKKLRKLSKSKKSKGKKLVKSQNLS